MPRARARASARPRREPGLTGRTPAPGPMAGEHGSPRLSLSTSRSREIELDPEQGRAPGALRVQVVESPSPVCASSGCSTPRDARHSRLPEDSWKILGGFLEAWKRRRHIRAGGFRLLEWRLLGRAALVSGILVACGPGSESGSTPASAPEPAPASGSQAAEASQVSAAATAEAEQIFATRCYTCHGSAGAGDGPASASLTPTPRNLQDPAWQQSDRKSVV